MLRIHCVKEGRRADAPKKASVVVQARHTERQKAEYINVTAGRPDQVLKCRHRRRHRLR